MTEIVTSSGYYRGTVVYLGAGDLSFSKGGRWCGMAMAASESQLEFLVETVYEVDAYQLTVWERAFIKLYTEIHRGIFDRIRVITWERQNADAD